MGQVALLNPDTLARIRSSAHRPAADIARELGWDVAQLKRVAARFRIELMGGDGVAPSVLALPIAPPVPKAARMSDHAQVLAKQPLTRRQTDKIGAPCFGQDGTAISASSTLVEIISALPRRQAQILDYLASHIDGRFIAASEISCFIDGAYAPASISAAIAIIRSHLRPTRWGIESSRSRAGGGYRLVTLRAAP